MGRGNTLVRGKYEGLFYVDWDNFSNEYEDEDGEIITDYDMQREEWQDSLNLFKSDLKKRFKSFEDCDIQVTREEHAILENSLFYIAIEDNEWSMAIKLLQKEQDYNVKGNFENLQCGVHEQYLKGIQQCLFNQFETIGVYGGPWTHGTIKKEDFVLKNN